MYRREDVNAFGTWINSHFKVFATDKADNQKLHEELTKTKATFFKRYILKVGSSLKTCLWGREVIYYQKNQTRRDTLLPELLEGLWEEICIDLQPYISNYRHPCICGNIPETERDWKMRLHDERESLWFCSNWNKWNRVQGMQYYFSERRQEGNKCTSVWRLFWKFGNFA